MTTTTTGSGVQPLSVPADAQAVADPPRPAAPDGWSPDRVVAIRSRSEGGFVGSAVNFTLGGVQERPGQRLSTAQVDALAPFYAKEFGLDERYVRGELAKVYLYVGGPSVAGNAMTIGHHVYVPDEQSLKFIVSPQGKHWLSHELAHTMQFLAYDGASPQRFLADYFSGMVVGKDPTAPGSGDGSAVWGALFTGLRTVGKTPDEIGEGARTIKDTLASTLLPAAVVSVPVALTASSAIGALRATTGRNVLGTGSALRTALGIVAAPAIAGSVLGAYDEQLGGHARWLAAAAGGALAGGALLAAGAFRGIGSARTLGRAATIAIGGGLTLAGAGIGLVSATASRNTVHGWSSSASVLHALRHRPGEGETEKPLDLQLAVHDSHWKEIDAEAVALRFLHGTWDKPHAGDPPVEGRTPTAPTTTAGRIRQDVTDWLDWGVKVPLIVGVPAAVAVGAGVLGARTGTTVLRTTIKEGKGIGAAIAAALKLLGSSRQGVLNSLNVGGAVTVAPLIAGGLSGPLAYQLTGSETTARVTGAAAGAVTTGAMLTLLLRGKGSSLIAMSGKVAAGMAVGAALGLLSGGVATDAVNPRQRRYDPAS